MSNNKKRIRSFDKLLLSSSSLFSVQEAYKTLRTNVAFSMPGGESKCIGISSANRGEGKSSIAVNLAISFAQLGKKVVLVDCDMRLPTVARKLGIQKSPGLSDYLVGEKEINECFFKVSKSGFSVIPSGNIPPDPTTLLESRKMHDLIDVLKNHYDLVFIDLPPVSPVPDAIILSKCVDGYLLVVRHDDTEYKDVSETLKQFDFADAKILGFVYNNKPQENHRKYKSKYYYNYYRKASNK